MKKFTLLPLLVLAMISLNGMAGRFGQQVLPALRNISKNAQLTRLPATIQKTCPASMRLFSSSSRSQGGYNYAGGQQASFGGREALLLGSAALAGGAALNYFNTPEGKLLERAYAAEQEYPTQDVLKNFLKYLATPEDLHNLEKAFYAHPELLPLVKQKIDHMSEKEFFAFANAAEAGGLVEVNANDLLPSVIKKIVNLPEESGFFSSGNFITFMTKTKLGEQLGDIVMNEFYMFPAEAALLGQKIIKLSDKNFVTIISHDPQAIHYSIEYNPQLIEAFIQKFNGLNEAHIATLRATAEGAWNEERPLNSNDYFREVGEGYGLSHGLTHIIRYLEINKSDSLKNINVYGPYIVALAKNSSSAVKKMANQYNKNPVFQKFIDDAYAAHKGSMDGIEFEKIIHAATATRVQE